MNVRVRVGLARRLTAIAVAAMLLAAFGAYEYLQTTGLQAESSALSADESTISSLDSQLESLALSSACAQKPPQPTEQSKLYPNGTQIVNTGYPIFTLQPGSVGTFCMTYEGGSAQPAEFNGTFHAYDWNSSAEPAGILISSNATQVTVPPGQNATVAYAVEASSNEAGYFSVGKNDAPCLQAFELAISTDPSRSTFSNFPGLLGEVTPGVGAICQFTLPPFPGQFFTGFNGFGVTYLKNTQYISADYNVTSRYVSSVVQSPSQQNITFSVGVHSFASPITLFFDTGPSSFDTLRVFQRNPYQIPTPGDPCDWLGGQAGNGGDETEVPVESVPGITVSAPTIQMQPFSNATFKFSMEIDNPPPGYYITFLGFAIEVTGQRNSGFVNLATYFPINPPFGQLDENISGSCPVY